MPMAGFELLICGSDPTTNCVTAIKINVTNIKCRNIIPRCRYDNIL